MHPSRLRLRLGVASVLFLISTFAAVAAAEASDRQGNAPRPQSVRLDDSRLSMDDTLDGPVIDLTIRNEGPVALELAVARVARGTTVRQMIEAAVGGIDDPPFVVDDPGSVFFLGRGELVRYQRRLTPGSYIFFVPRADGAPQLERNAYRAVRVLDNVRRELPESARRMALGDAEVSVPRLHAGAQRYTITNTGTVPHEVFIIGVRDEGDLERADEIGAWLEGGQLGPPPVPVHLPGSHQSIDPGVTVILTLDLRAATTYAFIDFQTGLQAVASTRR